MYSCPWTSLRNHSLLSLRKPAGYFAMVTHILYFILPCPNENSATRLVGRHFICMDIYGVKPEINQCQTLLNYGFIRGDHIFHFSQYEPCQLAHAYWRRSLAPIGIGKLRRMLPSESIPLKSRKAKIIAYLWSMIISKGTIRVMIESSSTIRVMIESSSTLKYHQYDKILFQKYVLCDQEMIVVVLDHS